VPPPPHGTAHIVERILYTADGWETHWGLSRATTVMALRSIADQLYEHADALDQPPPRLRVVGGRD
jgi:hypothetical protein